MFAARIPSKNLAVLSRNLGTMLQAGVQLRRAIEVSSNKFRHPATKKALQEVVAQIQEGQDIAAALRSQGDFFPGLFIDMIAVAEETGAIPEVLLHLAEHYENNQRLKRETISSLTWPGIQLTLAVLVIAVLIVVLGALAESGKGMDMTALTFGLSGPTGAIIWLSGTFGSVAALFVGYLLLQRAMAAKQIVDPILINVPVVGHCMRSFAIARFSWAYFLTQQSGMPVTRSLEASLKATSNGAFMNAIGPMCHDVRAGSSIVETFTESRLFPEDYLEMVAVAEESGTVPEALHRLSPQFEESARRSLKNLTRVLSVVVWLTLAGFVIFFVFKFIMMYVDMLTDAASGKF